MQKHVSNSFRFKEVTMKKVEINHLSTEQRNPLTLDIDQMSILEILKVMNAEDQTVAVSVQKELPYIEVAIKHIIFSLKKGGRLIYIGSGTSGRIGVLDAVECPPTFSTTDEVIGFIAGGNEAFIKAKEGMEDSYEQGAKDMRSNNITQNDVVVGLAASGRTPHTIGALKQAKDIGAYTVALTCNKNSKMKKVADIAIEIDTGPEVITGSTRLKAGTAQKMVANMLSTVSMIGIGKTYSNLMVDLNPSNEKLVERSIHIIQEACYCSYDHAKEAFEKSGRKPKIAILMILLECNKEEAETYLNHNENSIRKSLASV